ncbi:MAG: methionyl-tRNA formyltransferase [Tissierellia bacterium]|nr:methionyl-tRNA formyltransferase [Tissierellia bacterium]
MAAAIRVVYMGTPEFAVQPLAKLLESEDFCVPLVITQKDKRRHRGKLLPCPVKEYALSKGVCVYETDQINSQEALDAIRGVNPDFLVVTAFGQILKEELLASYPDRILNIHASLLPKYRGASPIHWALLDGEKVTGISIMLVERGLDSGDVLYQLDCPIHQNDDYLSLSDSLSELGAKALLHTLTHYDGLYPQRSKQNPDHASFTHRITKDMGHLDFTKTALEIDQQRRGLIHWPGIYFYYKGELVKLHDFDIIDKYNDMEPGWIFDITKDGLLVNCKDRCLVLKEIQFPGKKRVKVSDYLRGNSIEKTKLE